MEVFEKDEAEYWYALGVALRKAREVSGLKQRELVEKLGISRTVIANTETGRQRMSAYRLKQVCELFKIDPLKILDPPTPPPRRSATKILSEIDKAEEKLLELRAEKKSLGLGRLRKEVKS